MKSPTKRKKAELICPVDEGLPKKTQTQIKREQREAVDQKTKELLNRNPTYEQLAKVLHTTLLEQDALLREREKLTRLESDIDFFLEIVDKGDASPYLKGAFIINSIKHHSPGSRISEFVEKSMALKSSATASGAALVKANKATDKEMRAKQLFEGNEQWLNSRDSSSSIATHMIQKHGVKEVGSHDSLQRDISKWRKILKTKK
jgi:mRNA deadenylase 3'-5' endonuclease subunit Ccr4